MLQIAALLSGNLERSGCQCVGDVKNIFKNHVFEAAPDLLRRKAADLSVDDFVDLIGRVVEAGKGRTAGKLRSYLRAAYSLAIDAKTDPAAPPALKTFGITVNPLASIGALSQFNRTRDRTLNAPELAAFMKRLDAISAGPKKDAMELCIFLGGQRPTQLLRARVPDVDLPAGTVTLYDPKGARTQARAHVLPLTHEAMEIAELRLNAKQMANNGPLFSTDGRKAMRPETISVMVTEICAEMVKAGEVRELFELRDIRRTAETMLAGLGVSRDLRGQLQSHGLGGVQQRHYDRHEYMLEKRGTLELWAAHLLPPRRRLIDLRFGHNGVSRTQQPACQLSTLPLARTILITEPDLRPSRSG
ncbi:MAG: integrase [Gammaproteobacteria bacterium]